MDVTSWYQSLSLSELEEHSCESSLKLRKRILKIDFQMVFKIIKEDAMCTISRGQQVDPNYHTII